MGPDPPTIHFQRVTARTVREICALSETLSPQQRKMVADNAFSIAQAHFSENAWFRAIYADEVPVGFMMMHYGSDLEVDGFEISPAPFPPDLHLAGFHSHEHAPLCSGFSQEVQLEIRSIWGNDLRFSFQFPSTGQQGYEGRILQVEEVVRNARHQEVKNQAGRFARKLAGLHASRPARRQNRSTGELQRFNCALAGIIQHDPSITTSRFGVIYLKLDSGLDSG